MTINSGVPKRRLEPLPLKQQTSTRLVPRNCFSPHCLLRCLVPGTALQRLKWFLLPLWWHLARSTRSSEKIQHYPSPQQGSFPRVSLHLAQGTWEGLCHWCQPGCNQTLPLSHSAPPVSMVLVWLARAGRLSGAQESVSLPFNISCFPQVSWSDSCLFAIFPLSFPFLSLCPPKSPYFLVGQLHSTTLP